MHSNTKKTIRTNKFSILVVIIILLCSLKVARAACTYGGVEICHTEYCCADDDGLCVDDYAGAGYCAGKGYYDVDCDTTAPAGTVDDTGIYTADNTQLAASWSFTDDESDIAEYQYKINDSSGTTIVDWTSTGTSTSVTKTGLTLTDTQIYYFNVKAKNNNALWSNVVSSDGITVDITPPTAGISINNGDTYASTTAVTLTLTYDDATSNVKECRYSNDGTWDTESWVSCSATKSWTLDSTEGTQTVYYQVKDNAGNPGDNNDNIVLDLTSPQCTISTITETSGYSYYDGTSKIYYNTVAGGSFDVKVTSADTDVQSVVFPDTVSNGATYTSPTFPVSHTYSWTTSSTYSSTASITIYDLAARYGTCSFTVEKDINPPQAGSVSNYASGYEDGYPYTTVTITLSEGNDAGSGLASAQLKRKSATLSNGNCGTFGSWENIGDSNLGKTFVTDDSLQNGYCYKYRYNVTDNVNNIVYFPTTQTNILKVDTTAPTASISGVSGYWVTEDEVTLSCSDTGTGCKSDRWYYYDLDGTCSASKATYTEHRTSDTLTIDTSHNDYLCLWVEDNAGNPDYTATGTQLFIKSETCTVSNAEARPDSYTDTGEYDDDTTIYFTFDSSNCDSCNAELNDNTPDESVTTLGFDTDTGTEGSNTYYVECCTLANVCDSGSDTITIDTTPPTFDSYSIQDCDHSSGNDCWVKQNTILSFVTRIYDQFSEPKTFYLALTKDGCTPGVCSAGDEIKSYVEDVESTTSTPSTPTSLLTNDDYFEISSVACTESGGCSGQYAQETWAVITGETEGNFKAWINSSDALNNVMGSYSTLGNWLIKIDNTEPSASISGVPANWQNTDATATVTCTDSGGSGCKSSTYGYKLYTSDPGTCPATGYTTATSVSITGHKFMCAYAEDNVGNSNISLPSEFLIEKTAPVALIGGVPADWQNTDATATITCTDSGGSNCKASSYGYILYGTEPQTCPTTGYTTGNSVTITEHKFMCAYVEDNAGNYDTEKAEFLVETSPPTCSVTGIEENSNYAYAVGTKVYYKTGTADSLTVNVGAADNTDVKEVVFPDIFATGDGATYEPAIHPATSFTPSHSYSWTTTSSESGDKTITAYDIYDSQGTCTFNIEIDSTAPTGGSVSYTNGYITSTDTTITVTHGTDAGSGLASAQLKRTSATLSNDACGTFSALTDIGNPDLGKTTVDDTLSDCSCYKYEYHVSDNVGNTGVFDSTNILKVDTTEPTAEITGVSGYWVTEDEVTLSCSDSCGCKSDRWYYYDGDGTCSASKATYTEHMTSNSLTISTYHNDYLCLWVEDNVGFSDYTETGTQLFIRPGTCTVSNAKARPDSYTDTGEYDTDDYNIYFTFDLSDCDSCNAELNDNTPDEAVANIDNTKTSGFDTDTGIEGSNTYYVKCCTIAGDCSSDSSGITIDTEPPDSYSIQINNDAAYTSSEDVSLSLTYSDATSSIDKCRYSNDGEWDDEQWETCSAAKSWTLDDTEEGERTVYYIVRDNVGHNSSSSDSITLDLNNPANTLNAYTPDPTNDSTPSYSGTATDTLSKIVDIKYNVDSGSWTAVDTFTKAKTVSYTFTTSTLSDGAHTITTKATDASGRETTSTDTITIDTTAPEASISGVSGSWVTSDTVTLSCSDTGGTGCKSDRWYYYDLDGTCSASSSTYTEHITSSSLTIDTSHNDYLCLWVEDNVGFSDYTKTGTQLFIKSETCTISNIQARPDSYITTGEYDDDTSLYLTFDSSNCDSCNAELNDNTPDESVTTLGFDTDTGIEGSNTYYVKCCTLANVCDSGSDDIYVDLTDPTIDSVTDAGVYTTVATLSASWTYTETESGIEEFQYSIGTSAGATNVVNWVNPSPSNATSVTRTDLTLSDGTTYYFNVKAKDVAGRWSTVVSSDGIMVDTTAPSTPAVYDGIGYDYDYTTASDSLSGSWSSSDTHSNIERYKYKINDSSDTTIVGWTSTTSTSATNTSLSLTDSETYYFNVKAKNYAGLWSSIGSSDGIIVDTEQPVCSIQSIQTTSSYGHVAGTTIYYNTNIGTTYSFTVNALASDTVGIEKVNFPTTVSAGGDDSSSPYSHTYTWSSSSTSSGEETITAYDVIGRTGTCTFSVIKDSDKPKNGYVLYTNGYTTATTAIVAVDEGDDGTGSGLVSAQLQRKSATLSNGNCGTFGGWTNRGDSSLGKVSVTDTIANGKCYMYQYIVTDNVGNTEVFGSTDVLKVDTTPPTAGITINNGDAYTSTTAVILSLTYSDALSGIDKCRYSNDGTWDTESWVSCSVAKSWTLNAIEGTKTVYYQVRDKAGKTSSSQDSIILDLNNPTNTLNAYSPDPTSETSITYTGKATDTFNIVDIKYKIDSGSWTNVDTFTQAKTVSYTFTPTLSDGAHTIETKATDASGRETTSTDTITIDTQDPTAEISDVSTTWVTEDEVTLSCSDDGTGCKSDRWYYYDLDGTCSASKVVYTEHITSSSLIIDTSHNDYICLWVEDSVGNSDYTATGSRLWVRAGTCTVSNAQARSDSYTATGEYDDDTNIYFTFDLSDCDYCNASLNVNPPDESVAGIDNTATSGFDTDLGTEGTNTYYVKCCTLAGVCDSDSDDIHIDTFAPETYITSGPTGSYASTSATFEFSCDEAVCTFECKLDTGSFSACSSPKPYYSLSEDSHEFNVRAVDVAGNPDSTPATRDWNVDISPPLRSGRAPTGTVTTTSAELFLRNDEPATCKYSTTAGLSYNAMTNSFSSDVLEHSKIITGLGDNDDQPRQYTFYVKCKDYLGNENEDDYVISFNVDIPEICDNSIDDDNNAQIDCADSDCAGDYGPAGRQCCMIPSDCSNLDDNCDGSDHTCKNAQLVSGIDSTCCLVYSECIAAVAYNTAYNIIAEPDNTAQCPEHDVFIHANCI